MLLGGGTIAVFGSEAVGLEGAGPLGVVAAAFVSAWLWSTQGWDIEDVSMDCHELHECLVLEKPLISISSLYSHKRAPILLLRCLQL